MEEDLEVVRTYCRRGYKWRKLAVLAAMVLVVAAPTTAQVSQEAGQESDSGDVESSFSARCPDRRPAERAGAIQYTVRLPTTSKPKAARAL